MLHAQHILQILLIFSLAEGYWLQFSIPGAHFVYTVWHCTGQHWSSMYVCTYHLFAGMLRLFFIVKCGTFSALCMYSKFGHYPHPLGYFVPNFISFAASIPELAHGVLNHSINHSSSLFDAPGTEACTSEQQSILNNNIH